MSNSEKWLRTPAYMSSKPKDNKFVEKEEEKGKVVLDFQKWQMVGM